MLSFRALTGIDFHPAASINTNISPLKIKTYQHKYQQKTKRLGVGGLQQRNTLNRPN
jgi:hypothetical protein